MGTKTLTGFKGQEGKKEDFIEDLKGRIIERILIHVFSRGHGFAFTCLCGGKFVLYERMYKHYLP